MESNLQVINNTPTSENQIIKSALTAPLVRSAIPYEIDGAVSVAIDRALFYLGSKMPIEDRDMVKVAVIDDAKRHFPNLTIAEIGVAIDNGVKGMYGKVVGLAPKDVFDWLTAYSISEQRKNQASQLAKEGEPKPEPTDEEKATLYWNNLVNAWLTFKKDGCYNDHGNSVYNTLLANGKINYSDGQMADFMRIAKADLIKEYNPLKHVGNVVKVNEFKAIIAEITSGGDDNTRVKVAARKLALNHFFGELLEMETEITDLFAE